MSGLRRALIPCDNEQKTEPILAALAESGPTDGSSKRHFQALESCFLADFPPHARGNVFIGFEFAAQAVVLSPVMVARPGVAMDHEDRSPVDGEYVAEGRQYRGVRHFAHRTTLCRRIRGPASLPMPTV